MFKKILIGLLVLVVLAGGGLYYVWSNLDHYIKVAIEKLQSRDLCRVRVHPDQAPAIRASFERFSNSHKVELVADPSLQIGDVMFETATGTLDASIESQLQEIDRGFADRLER